ncbi:testis-specific gene 13 protein-like isoform X1 [Coregonus clupeaformis]|uniref:testis-specific gene 13 protein-like isoform X1 n=1 Tax=Coregonus clupeaformis TaxID=59861 RepID=UPI001E1C9996|nr:testis-specific gene 13 protein-like isoform X1 [Coregonus clupeaformis]
MQAKKALGNKAFLQPVSKDEIIAPKAREIYQKEKVLDSKEIWNILREESESKLAQMETAIDGPSVIKAFNDRLECQKLLEVQGQGKSSRHKNRVALMFKASEANLDRTALLIANNPLPDLHNLKEGDSPTKYLAGNPLAPAPAPTKRLEAIRGRQSGLLPLKHPLKLPSGMRRAGSKRSSELNHGCEQVSVCSSLRIGQRIQTGTTGKKVLPLDLTQSTEVKDQCTELCEPLTLSALLETAVTVTAPGQGAFRYGQTAYWNGTSSWELPP